VFGRQYQRAEVELPGCHCVDRGRVRYDGPNAPLREDPKKLSDLIGVAG
jgi:hypothetical protein